MEIQFTKNATTLDVMLKGRFTFKAANEFRKILLMISPEITTVQLLFHEVEFIDSVALGLLLMLREETLHQEITIRIISPQGQPERMLAVTRLNQIFTIIPSSVAVS